MTPHDIFGMAAQLAQLGFLCGIFLRIGRLGATLESHDKRLSTLERFKNVFVG